jgi:hypothetical protein
MAVYRQEEQGSGRAEFREGIVYGGHGVGSILCREDRV